MTTRNLPLFLYVALLCAALLMGLSSGAVHLSWMEMWDAFRAVTGFSPQQDSSNAAILMARLWRVLGCACIGASLALCGSVLQRLLRNPLADPFVLGVSAGGTTAVVTTLVLGSVPLASHIWGVQVHFIASLSGCLSALFFVLFIRRRLATQQVDTSLPLVGLVLNSFLSAVLMVVVSLADPFRLAEAQRWMLGFVGFISPLQVGVLASVLFFAGGFLLSLKKHIDALSFGHEFARSVGISAQRVERLSLIAVSALVAAVVGVAGSVGFVGLIVPHLAKIFHVQNPRVEWPASLLLGASLMVFADLLSRSTASPAELPVGIFTAAIGAPLLIFILVKKSRTGRAALGQ